MTNRATAGPAALDGASIFWTCGFYRNLSSTANLAATEVSAQELTKWRNRCNDTATATHQHALLFTDTLFTCSTVNCPSSAVPATLEWLKRHSPKLPQACMGLRCAILHTQKGACSQHVHQEHDATLIAPSLGGLQNLCQKPQADLQFAEACSKHGHTAQGRCCLGIGCSFTRTPRADLHLQGGRRASGWGTGL